MLSLDSLIAGAKARGMPTNKMRGILREYLQILILRELYHLELGRKLYFTGGTYLRLVHGTKRFSEDLDFNVDTLTKSEFEATLHKVCLALEKEGLVSKLEFSHWQNILVAELIFPEVEKFYGIVSAYTKKSGMVIKVESNRPKWKIKTETLVVSGFGYLFPVICTERGALFADKIDALLHKNRARHLFDIIFMLSQKYPINSKVLKSLGITDDPLNAILQRVKNFSKAELNKLAESLQPFLFDEREVELIKNASAIVQQLADNYVTH